MSRANQCIFLTLRHTSFCLQSAAKFTCYVQPPTLCKTQSIVSNSCKLPQQICAWNFHSSHCHASYSDMSTAGSESFLDSLWTREQTEQILNKLNTLPPDKLKSTLKISQNLSENIAASRPFTSIGQIMALPRMNILSLEKLCRQAIKQQKKVETKLKMSALSHPLNQQVAQSVQQVTTLELGAKSFGYLTMTKDFELVEYGYRKYEPPPLSDHMKIVTRMNELAGSSRFGDLTLITSPLYKPSKIKSELVHRTHMTHLLYAFLGAVSAGYDVSQVYTIKEKAVAAEFGLYVANSLVSPAKVTSKLLREQKWNIHNLKNFRQYGLERNKKDPEQQRTYDMLLLTNLFFMDKLLLPLKAQTEEKNRKHKTEDGQEVDGQHT